MTSWHQLHPSPHASTFPWGCSDEGKSFIRNISQAQTFNSAPFPSFPRPHSQTLGRFFVFFLSNIRSFTHSASSLSIGPDRLRGLYNEYACYRNSVMLLFGSFVCQFKRSASQSQARGPRDVDIFFFLVSCFMKRQWCNSCGTEVETQRKGEKGIAGILKWSRFTYHANFILTIKHPQQHALKGQTVGSFLRTPLKSIKIHYKNANHTRPHSRQSRLLYRRWVYPFYIALNPVLLHYTIAIFIAPSWWVRRSWFILYGSSSPNYRSPLMTDLIC